MKCARTEAETASKRVHFAPDICGNDPGSPSEHLEFLSKNHDFCSKSRLRMARDSLWSRAGRLPCPRVLPLLGRPPKHLGRFLMYLKFLCDGVTEVSPQNFT